MRKIIVEVEVSVDGGLGGAQLDFWQQVFPLHSDDVKEYLNDLLFLPDALLMGRKTYEGFAQIWPTRQGKDADRINGMPKFVASRTLKAPLQWNATLMTGDAAAEITKLKQQPGTALVQYGVGELTNTMLQHRLVDELRVLVYPFAYGGDVPRIFDHMGVHPLKLLSTQTFNSGVVALHYQPRS